GPFARGGKSRSHPQASDHDFKPEATLTPVGLFLPAFDDVSFYGVLSKVTSDCLVDCLTQWWESVGQWFAHISTLVINLD
ncbi:transposase, partial [Candidatus Entotheonella serta]